jgi:hypothetical protein
VRFVDTHGLSDHTNLPCELPASLLIRRIHRGRRKHRKKKEMKEGSEEEKQKERNK